MNKTPQAGHFGLILPLATSAATLGLSLYQFPVFLSFLQADKTNSIAGKPLSRFWEPMLARGGGLITALGVVSAISGGVSARWLRTHQTLETTNVSTWYIAGSLLAFSHLAVIPALLGPIQRIIAAKDKTDEEADQGNREEMKMWLSIHTARLVLLDLPALWCFAEGVALSFWITH